MFYNEATDYAVKQIEEQGLDRYVRFESFKEFLRYMVYIFVLITILCASWNITTNDNNNHNIEITNKK